MIASRVLKNFLSLSAAGVVHSIVAAASTIYLARVLEPEGFGRVNFAFAFVQYFLIFSAMGLDTIGVREVARNRERVREYAGNIFAMKFLFACLFFLLLLAVIPLLDRPEETNRLLLLYGLALFPTAFFFEWTWQGLERMGNIGISKMIRQGLYLLLLVLLVESRADLMLVPAIFVGVNVLYALILFGLFLMNYGPVRLSFDMREWKLLLSASIPVGITILLATMIYSMNSVFLGFLRSDSEVGYYNAAFQIISFMLMFMCVFFDALFPTISNLYVTSREKMGKVLNLSGKLLFLAVTPVVVGTTILAPRIMHILYGERYDDGVIALQILIWVLFVVAANSVYARGLLAGNMQNYYMKVVFLQVLTLILLDILLIPRFGLGGAAAATLAAETAGLYFYYRGFIRIARVPLGGVVLKSLLASLLMGCLLLLFQPWNVYILVVMGALAYFSMIYFMKVLEVHEVRWAVDRILGRPTET